ncbi:MAG: 50S ribosomal protein L22 [Candidatus Pacebacteria bacterium]|nr:50S ribosomal protein L22 [Candidatus Paceibacterota bacterium]
MKAFLKNYRQSPRKVRLVADLVRGKSIEKAVIELDFLPKRASLPIKKLILSAVANALQTGVQKEELFIKEIRADKGLIMKRMMPRAMGRGARINKRSTHINVALGLIADSPKMNKKANKKAGKGVVSEKTDSVEKKIKAQPAKKDAEVKKIKKVKETK